MNTIGTATITLDPSVNKQVPIVLVAEEWSNRLQFHQAPFTGIYTGLNLRRGETEWVADLIMFTGTHEVASIDPNPIAATFID
jgi:hypothetical protein